MSEHKELNLDEMGLPEDVKALIERARAAARIANNGYCCDKHFAHDLLRLGAVAMSNARPSDEQAVGGLTVRELAGLLGILDVEAARASARKTAEQQAAAEREMAALHSTIIGIRTVGSMCSYDDPAALQRALDSLRAAFEAPPKRTLVLYAAFRDEAVGTMTAAPQDAPPPPRGAN